MPEFNEERTVLGVLEEAAPHVDRIIIVDDGSQDASHARIVHWLRHAPVRVDLLRHATNRGMSGALETGFARVQQLLALGELGPDDVVVNLDADGQHDPAEIPLLVCHLQERRLDVALGRRDLGGYPRYKVVGNRLLSLSGGLLAGYRYQDIECGFRVLRVATVGPLLEYFSGHRYGCAQEIGVILPRLGFRVDNRFAVRVRTYREGARFRDGLVNATMGLLAALRVLFRVRTRGTRRLTRLLASVQMNSGPGGAPLSSGG